MLKLFTQNFWYDVLLRTTYFKFLSGKKVFNRNEIKSIKNEFKKLITSNQSMLGDVYSGYHLSWCSAILATYRACLRIKMEKTEAIEFTTSAIFENMQAESIAQSIENMLDQAEDPFKTIVQSSKHQEVKFFGNTFTFIRSFDDNNHYLVLFHKCFYHDFFRKNNALELMQIACRWDFISWSKGIIPEKHHIQFSRTETLGLDEKPCNFDFQRIS